MFEAKTGLQHVPEGTPRRSGSNSRLKGEGEVQPKLEAEPKRLKKILKLGYELKVLWVPNGNSKLPGDI